MDLIIETDVGHDLDDFFTICYLAAAGINIRAIVVTPGDKDQLAVARLLSEELGFNVPIGYSKVSEKYSSGSIHYGALNMFSRSKDGYGDGFGKDIIKETMEKYPDSEFFVIGPPSNVGRYLEEGGKPPKRLTMQGGYLPYEHHKPAVIVEKFIGQEWVPTFNMNGDVRGTHAILAADIKERRFCGKNVCHGVFLEKDILNTFDETGKLGRGEFMFMHFARALLSRGYGKKFHDPVAAACMLHPEIGAWVRGRPTRMKGGWTTTLDGNADYVLAELNHDRFWEYLRAFK